MTSVFQFPMPGASSLLALGLDKCLAWELRWNLGNWNNDAASSYCASRFLITPARQERTVYTTSDLLPFLMASAFSSSPAPCINLPQILAVSAGHVCCVAFAKPQIVYAGNFASSKILCLVFKMLFYSTT